MTTPEHALWVERLSLTNFRNYARVTVRRRPRRR